MQCQIQASEKEMICKAPSTPCPILDLSFSNFIVWHHLRRHADPFAALMSKVRCNMA